MSKTRLEMFSDGVIAILITIMVLELRPPDMSAVEPYRELKHALPCYVLSFFVLAMYWNNHHHMMQLCSRVNGRIMWANMCLLFCLSLIPFTTAWLSEPEGVTSQAAAAYSVVAFMAGMSWLLLKLAIVAEQGPGSALQAAYGKDVKGFISGGLTFVAIFLAFVHPFLAIALQVAVLLMWIVPDKRIEATVAR